MTIGRVRWPAEFDPDHAPIHVIRDLRMEPSLTRAWADLFRAANWPRRYGKAPRVEMGDGGGDRAAGARFTWRTLGVDLSSQVAEFVPFEWLAISAEGLGVSAYHA